MISRRIASLPRHWWAGAGVLLVTLLAVVGSYVEAHPAHFYAGLHLTRHPPLVAYLLVGAGAVALVWRNRWPVGVLALAVAGDVGWAALGQIDGAALVPVIVALYWVALTRPRHVALAAGLTGAVAIFLAEGTSGPFGWLGGPNATMWPELLAAGAVGGYVAARRQWRATERMRQQQAEQMREDETRRRVDAERMRIARELHDVVAHSMAMINVQATAAILQLADNPARVSEALQAIRGASKSGLRELRAILEVLGQTDDDARPAPSTGTTAGYGEALVPAQRPGPTARRVPVLNRRYLRWATARRSLPAQRPGPSGPVSGRCAGDVPQRGAERSGGFRGVAPRASTVGDVPQRGAERSVGSGGSPPRASTVPDLRGLQALVDATSAAGTPTTLRTGGDVMSLPPPVALAAYRIVQESLTNVVRHAGPAVATVTLLHEDGRLAVDVVNDGAAGPHAPFGDGAGTGLTGMRERAAALGGTLEAGTRPEGGFRVHAELPAPAAQTAEPPREGPAGEVRSERRVSPP